GGSERRGGGRERGKKTPANGGAGGFEEGRSAQGGAARHPGGGGWETPRKNPCSYCKPPIARARKGVAGDTCGESQTARRKERSHRRHCQRKFDRVGLCQGVPRVGSGARSHVSQ